MFTLANIVTFTETSKMEYVSPSTKQTIPLMLSRFALFLSDSYDSFSDLPYIKIKTLRHFIPNNEAFKSK